jgi:hypothetical protein
VADFDPLPLLATLERHEVEFVVVGGIAAIAQGYPLPTTDLDVTAQAFASQSPRCATSSG